jgi:hypothetical protein
MCCEHIVEVIGYCKEGDQQISIYEYMPGGILQGFYGQLLLHIVQSKSK